MKKVSRASSLVLVLLVLFASSCTSGQQKKRPGKAIAYDLNRPTIQIKLPKLLNEISGLCYVNTQVLAGIQDEKGVVFMLDPNTGVIDEQLEFGEKGDYEGIALENSTLWVIDSKGTLFSINNGLIESIQLPFAKKDEIEGLCYSPLNNSLLIAAKCNNKEKDDEKWRYIYAFDIQQKRLLPKPMFSVKLKDLAVLMGEKNNADLFRPSGIAVHPQNGNIYILGSVGKVLVVLSSHGELIGYQRLDKSVHPQPEGICFDPNGDLYISNEGKNGKAQLLKFAQYRQ